MNCPNCNQELKSNAKFCKNCGTQIGEVQGPKVVTSKKSIVKTILLLVFLFLTVAQAAFLFMYFTLDKKEKPTKNNDSTPIVEQTNPSLNFNDMKLNLDKKIKYEIYKGKLVLEKPSEWNAVVSPIGTAYSFAKSNLEGQKNTIQAYKYLVETNETKMINGKERIVFEILNNAQSGLIIYDQLPGDKILLIEVYYEGDKEVVLTEVLNIFDNATPYEEINAYKDSQMLSTRMAR